MTTPIVFNGVDLSCELRNGGLFTAWTNHGDDISPILNASWTMAQEAIRLVREEQDKDAG